MLAAGADGAQVCQSDDLAIAPFPTRDLVSRPFETTFGFLQSWNSLPILSSSADGADYELHCYGS